MCVLESLELFSVFQYVPTTILILNYWVSFLYIYTLMKFFIAHLWEFLLYSLSQLVYLCCTLKWWLRIIDIFFPNLWITNSISIFKSNKLSFLCYGSYVINLYNWFLVILIYSPDSPYKVMHSFFYCEGQKYMGFTIK